MRYLVKVGTDSGEQALELDAPDEAGLRQAVAGMGLSLVDAVPAAPPWRGWSARRGFRHSLFTQQLIALLDAGLSIVEAVETLGDESTDAVGRAVCQSIAAALHEGEPFARALERQRAQFPPFYIASLRNAAQPAQLAEALARYDRYDAQRDAVRRKIAATMAYPSVVIATGGFIVLFLALCVIPGFSQMFASMREIPLAANALLVWADLVAMHGGVLLAAIVCGLAGAACALRSEAVRAPLLALVLRLPGLADYHRLFELARFYRTVGLLLASGIPVAAAVELSARQLPAAMQAALSEGRDEIRAGRLLSAALQAADLATPVTQRLIREGELSGDLAGMLTRCADFCDAEIDRAIDTTMRIVEPMSMLVVGGIVGAVVLMLYMPIFELAGSVE